eukprot:395994-Hanusia_phi.AAC.1
MSVTYVRKKAGMEGKEEGREGRKEGWRRKEQKGKYKEDKRRKMDKGRGGIDTIVWNRKTQETKTDGKQFKLPAHKADHLYQATCNHMFSDCLR